MRGDRAIVKIVCAIGASSLLLACGDDVSGHVCRVEEWGRGYYFPFCRTPIVLALRYSDGLHASQDEIDYIYAALKKAYQLDPLFGGAEANLGIGVAEPDYADVTSSNPAITAHWSQGEVQTGDAAVDSVFYANGADGVQVTSSLQGEYSIQFHEPLNMRVLAEMTATTVPDTTIDTGVAIDLGHSTTLQFVDGAVIGTFEFGWGDCLEGCFGTHWFQVLMPDQGDATLLFDWGAPIPPDVLAGMRMRPPPP